MQPILKTPLLIGRGGRALGEGQVVLLLPRARFLPSDTTLAPGNPLWTASRSDSRSPFTTTEQRRDPFSPNFGARKSWRRRQHNGR